MLAEVANAPMREAIARLEKQYEVDKKNALGIFSSSNNNVFIENTKLRQKKSYTKCNKTQHK